MVESDEDKPGVIVDYDDAGDLASLEILDASRRVTETKRLEFQIADCAGIRGQVSDGGRLWPSQLTQRRASFALVAGRGKVGLTLLQQ
jgi:Protein of unknown function (DUF2283)